MVVDLAIVAFIGAFAVRGCRRGLLASLTGFLGFIAAAAAAVFGYRTLAAAMKPAGMSEGAANLIAGLTIFASVSALAWVTGRALTRVLRLTMWRGLNSAGGGALAALWALSWVTAVLLALSVFPAPRAVASSVDRSALAKGIIKEAPAFAKTIARTDLRALLELFQPGEQKVSLVATHDFRRLAVAEGELFDLVNEERRARRLKPVRWDEDLAEAARAHAADMYVRGYFAHESPSGTTPGDRLRAREIRFGLAAENLALGPTVQVAHANLMGSIRHRKHILATGFARLGVGVMYGRQGFLVVQEFAG